MNVPSLVHSWHLARRFVGSLDPRPPSAADERWVEQHLSQAEHQLWLRLSNPDRRHGIQVARAVAAALGDAATPPVMAAALLHDAGKVISGLGTFARVGATLFWAVMDHDRARTWLDHDVGAVRRLAQYRLHPELGADLLADGGADPLTVAWAREHHQPADRWSVPGPVASVLKSCDDD